ncbi:MAG: sigma-54 dependent transcriptional regulator [Candidatus Marinimicrobia bacterium]|nr:sigma-54 dependent transcriptional regulator [Candidatus Neomarinimicrobiota bacterium]MCF7829739.1 sigma-54 dependent transcriptional regulator [Candidatus Neomarinimicrobiota bacterium]MCF7881689.1 sigma-54 dependent transcriptional regulator [Candidatus Neomarinimicrobiota bacterium]
MNNSEMRILVIEDDETMRSGIETVLRKSGYTIESAADGNTGSRLYRETQPELVITDLKLPGKSGMDLLQEFKASNPDVPVILISAYGTIDIAVNALKLGARDFIAKPFTIDELRTKVEHVLEGTVRSDAEGKNVFHEMVGTTPVMQELFGKIRDVARVDSPVLITGESGSGKELAARAIHRESHRSSEKFLAVNCGALTETLLESELFGHEKGAFTGAVQQHNGVFEQADHGTIFLDEVGEISPRMQVKLLRVLQNHTFHRVGGGEEIQVDIRVIAATNQDLKEGIRQDNFREDLYYRLNVVPLYIPPLRNRTDDIPALVRRITQEKSSLLGRQLPEWTESAVEKLQNYAWPGNIRELENFLERLLVFNRTDRITARDIYLDDLQDRDTLPDGSLPEVLESTEYKMILNALKKAGGVKQQAARLLGINTSTLYYKMEKYGIQDEASS